MAVWLNEAVTKPQSLADSNLGAKKFKKEAEFGPKSSILW
jgi:hypothetical protein